MRKLNKKEPSQKKNGFAYMLEQEETRSKYPILSDAFSKPRHEGVISNTEHIKGITVGADKLQKSIDFMPELN